uniref:pectate lyase n=1 Tax=Ditylenchus dipsaci TaxID=166011 RepID=A0A915CZH7_9BILA
MMQECLFGTTTALVRKISLKAKSHLSNRRGGSVSNVVSVLKQLMDSLSISKVVPPPNTPLQRAVLKCLRQSAQHNGGGSLKPPRLPSDNIGKLYRSCGNCEDPIQEISHLEQCQTNHVKVAVVGINSNYGATATSKG